VTSATDLARQKAALRAGLRARRAAVAAARGAEAAAAAAQWLEREVALARSAAIAGYWPLADELDPRPALLRLLAAGHPLALPRMIAWRAPLAFHAWRPDDVLVPGRFKVMEPSPAAPETLPDVLLVPLLGFDRRGNRLGHGAGFYDRTLRALRARAPAPLAIGLAFAVQELAEVPAGPEDEPLDLVVTEAGVLRCAPAPALALQPARGAAGQGDA
jgi:5-formyltetrahydrofolate cyclo-ligase